MIAHEASPMNECEIAQTSFDVAHLLEPLWQPATAAPSIVSGLLRYSR